MCWGKTGLGDGAAWSSPRHRLQFRAGYMGSGPKEQGVQSPRVPAGVCRAVGAPRTLLPPTSIHQQSLAGCCSAPAHGTAWTHLAANIPFDAPHPLFNISSASLLLLPVTGAVPPLRHPTASPFPWPWPCTALVLRCLYPTGTHGSTTGVFPATSPLSPALSTAGISFHRLFLTML